LVAVNPNKDHYFNPENRLQLAKEATDHIDNVYPELNYGLTENFINDRDADVLIRGLRNGDDLRYEMELEEHFRNVTDAETIYPTPQAEHMRTSSTVVRNFLKSRNLKQAVEYVPVGARNLIHEFEEE
jgi:pantetheine-phosphate adenylyltransferase